MTTTTPSAPDEVVLDERGLHEALEAHLRLFPHMLKNDGIHAIHDIISTYLRNAPSLFRWGDDDEVLPVSASAQPAGVTEEQVEAFKHKYSELSQRYHWLDSIPGTTPDSDATRELLEAVRLPSPTDTRERVLTEDDERLLKLMEGTATAWEAATGTITLAIPASSACTLRKAIALINRLKTKPTEAPVEDGWVRVPKEPLEDLSRINDAIMDLARSGADASVMEEELGEATAVVIKAYRLAASTKEE